MPYIKRTSKHISVKYSFFYLLILLISSCSTTKKAPEQVDYFADNAFGNPLALVQQPAGIHEKGITYVSYQGPEEDPYIASYNHKTKKWSGPYKAGVSELGKDPKRKKRIDNHGKPTLLIDNLGYIHIFFGGHGGGKKHGNNLLGSGGYGKNKHAISKKPYDITEWEEVNNISPFGTYNQAIKMDNGDIYLVYRHGAHRSDWVYQKSTDHGRTFNQPVSFLKHKERNDIKATDSWYAWASKGQGDDIIFAYDYHLCWHRGEGPKGLSHITRRHDIYYMVFNTRTNTWKNIHGEPLTLPLTREKSDELTLVARTGEGNWTFNGSAHIDKYGHPHIATNIGKNLGSKTGGPKQTSYIYWNGKHWSDITTVNPQSKKNNTNTRGDFIFTEDQKATFILGYSEKNNGVIAYFNSDKTGAHFTKDKELLRIKNATWALTAVILNAHPEAQIVVAEKHPKTNWRRIYLVGENGPIKRDKTAATVLNIDASRSP